MKVVLDSNIWDKLSRDDQARDQIKSLCRSGRLEIIVPATLLRELKASPFDGVPDWFPNTVIQDSVFVLNHSRVDGSARVGEGAIFAAHRGVSRQVSDAVIVDTTDKDADVFVSEDRRARKRYAQLRHPSRSLDYSRFRAEVLSL